MWITFKYTLDTNTSYIFLYVYNGQKHYTICKSAFMNGCICNHVCVSVCLYFLMQFQSLYIKTGFLCTTFIHTHAYKSIQSHIKNYILNALKYLADVEIFKKSFFVFCNKLE